MQTTKIAVDEQPARAFELAAQWLQAGEVVAFPTETVYGLGALAMDAQAVHRIFLAKGRPADNPLIVHVATLAQAQALSRCWNACAQKLAQAFWPGPLSLIVAAAPEIPSVVTAGLDSVALRMPSHPVALRLIRENGPIAAPSANVSGRPSPVTAQHVWEDLQGKIPLILDGGTCAVGVESTVVDTRGEVPCILRPGGVTREQIVAVCGACTVAQGVFEPVHGKAASPGMLHRHYAPRGQATLIWPGPHLADRLCRGYDEAVRMGQTPVILCSAAVQAQVGARRTILCDAAGDMAHGLFAALRQADAMGAQRILIQGVPMEDTGMAYMNRALRAAGFDVQREDMD